MTGNDLKVGDEFVLVNGKPSRIYKKVGPDYFAILVRRSHGTTHDWQSICAYPGEEDKLRENLTNQVALVGLSPNSQPYFDMPLRQQL